MRDAHGHTGRACIDYYYLGPAAPLTSTFSPLHQYQRHAPSSSSPLRRDTCRKDGRIDGDSYSALIITKASASLARPLPCATAWLLSVPHRVASTTRLPDRSPTTRTPAVNTPRRRFPSLQAAIEWVPVYRPASSTYPSQWHMTQADPSHTPCCDCARCSITNASRCTQHSLAVMPHRWPTNAYRCPDAAFPSCQAAVERPS